MRKRITKFAAAIGLAVGLVVIGGSVVGGIALAMDHGQPPAAPASVNDSTSDGHDVANVSDDQAGDEQNSDEQGSDGRSGTGTGDDQSSDRDGDDGTSAEADDPDDPDDDTEPDDD